MQTLTESALDLFQLIEKGKMVEAMEKYYAKNVEMQENHTAPRIGKTLNIEKEKENLQRMKNLQSKLKSYAVNLDQSVVFSEWEYRFINEKNVAFILEEISVQRWASNKITHERFYYDNFKQL